MTAGQTSLLDPASRPGDNTKSPLIRAEQKKLDWALDHAVRWLLAQQQANGSFPSLETGQPAVTALCALALMSHGATPGEGERGAAIERAALFVLSCQQPDGLLSKLPPVHTNTLNAGHTSNYNHAIAGLMLSEVYGSTHGSEQPAIRRAIEEAIRYALPRLPQPKRTPADAGGWRYFDTWAVSDADLSITSWHLLFLRSARNAGFPAPAWVIDEALGYVRRCYDPDRRTFLYAVYNRMPSRAMAGAGILSFSLGGRHQTPMAMAAGDYLLNNPPGVFLRNDHYYYGAFYSSEGMFQLGGRYWREFYPPLVEALLADQNREGSWGPERYHYGAVFGTAYSTSLAILALTTPTQLLPIFQR